MFPRTSLTNPFPKPHLPRLEPFAPAIRDRFSAYKTAKSHIEAHEGGLAKFSEGYKERGFQVDARNGVRYTEWAPGAVEARLIGEFSEWGSDGLAFLRGASEGGVVLLIDGMGWWSRWMGS